MTSNSAFLLLLLVDYHSTSFSKDITDKFEVAETSRIIGGNQAKPKQFPYAVSIQEYNEDFQTYEHICTFSLITTQSVLGAAHCVVGQNKEILEVDDYIGVLGTVDQWNRTNSVTFDEFIVHRGYNTEYYSNDIAIFVLSEPVKMSDSIRTIPLVGRSISFIGKRGTTIGWGFVHPSATRSTRILRYVDVDIVESGECEQYYGFLHKGQFCFGTEGRGGCDGDSGAPIIVRYRRKEVQMGILSFNTDPCAKDPSTGINVSYYNSWIRKNVVGKPVFIN